MNEQAESGEFLNITGRDKEIDRLIHILARKTKNNPILVGEAGVGKTAVVQGLVERILSGDVPPSFLGMTVISLDVPSIIAGSRVRGDVEERIIALVREAIESRDKIIFIDEIHMIVGAGSQGGRDPMDIGNILKPYLTDPNLRIIGATTTSEYHKYFDDDPALLRRFQPVNIEEIDKDSATEILNNLKKGLEQYHGVKIKEQAIIEAVNLSSKFIVDRYLPDKAIDLLDEAAATVKIGREVYVEPELSTLGEKLLKVQRRKEKALREDNMKEASKLKPRKRR
jgi:ATP-dependent Clp protease ATP-binding subunit ClpA